jgi:hypothetical protein
MDVQSALCVPLLRRRRGWGCGEPVGVETQQLIKSEACSEMQCFLFGRRLPAREIEEVFDDEARVA